MFKNKTIAIIGLGYVGLPLAIEFGKKRNVIGYDINKSRIDDLKSFIDKTKQINKSNFKKSKLISFTYDKNDLKNVSIFIITVPTPINKKNNPDLSLLKNACKLVGQFVKENNIVIFESTVFPGATEEICVPIIEKYSKLKCIFDDDKNKKGFYIGYSPERINPGDKKHTLTNIKKVVSGSTPFITNHINKLYKQIINAGTYVATSIRVAEAAKVIENTQRDLNISFINELSKIFSLMKLDTLDVLKTASTKWNFLNFQPGLVGGHCIGVDPYYLTYKSISLGYKPKVILSGRAINDSMGKYISKLVKEKINKKQFSTKKLKIGILGVTFKENCNDTRNSKVIDIINNLNLSNLDLKIHDPLADKKDFFKDYCYHLSDLKEFTKLDIIILAVCHNFYKGISIKGYKKMFNSKNKDNLIFDIKGILNKSVFEKENFEIMRL